MLQQLLFAQSVHYRSDTLRQAEENKRNHSKKFLVFMRKRIIVGQDLQHEVNKVGQYVDCKLHAVKGDGPAAGAVPPVQHTQAAPHAQNPHVTVQDECGANRDE